MSTPALVNVRVQQGVLQGQRIVSKDGGPTYDAFLGIPYAQKPVGSLRFKAPRPPESWEGTRSALEEGPISVQLDIFTGFQPAGEEDCLYLNVYTPQVPSPVTASSPERKNDSPWPIMVWIHPGGFANGSGGAREYGPEMLLAKDVVVITLNYRLGALGFLSLESPVATGNYGLKDVVAALRWIKANGAVFGGDVDQITIFGCSAGSAAVQLLQLSPSSKGLFHRAIAQSGSSLNTWSTTSVARERAIRLARALGATEADLSEDEKILEFLREKPALDILKATGKVPTEEERLAGSSLFMFTPTSEENITPADPEDEVFLPASPWDLLYHGRISHVPLIVGFTNKEGLLVDLLVTLAGKGIELSAILDRCDKQLDSVFPAYLKGVLPPGSEKRKEATERLRKLYFDGGSVCEATRNNYYDLQTDLMFSIRILEEARVLARRSPDPVYVYCFGVQGKLNRVSAQLGLQGYTGACHGDELSYLWNTSSPLPPIPKLDPNSVEAKTRERMVALWTNFAKTGNPTPEGDPALGGIHWPKLSRDVGSSVPHLFIGDALSVPQTGLIEKRLQFWDSLYLQLPRNTPPKIGSSL